MLRDGALDALHCGHVVVVDGHGTVLSSAGDPGTEIYPRSALKPFQTAASLEAIGEELPSDEVAVITASHTGNRTHQAVVRRVLDRAGLTTVALRCPPALPTDAAALRERPEPSRLAHNCSGKHAGFLLAAQRTGGDRNAYLSVDAPIQRSVLRVLRECCGVVPTGPGVDGCGAPAWRMPIVALARGFARLAKASTSDSAAMGHHSPSSSTAIGHYSVSRSAAADDMAPEVRLVAAAMRTHPLHVGGYGTVDSELMRASGGAVVAKRGAEGALGIAVPPPQGPLGIAIKVSDGGARALAPIAAAILARLRITVSGDFARPVVFGGGQPRGELRPAPDLVQRLTDLRR